MRIAVVSTSYPAHDGDPSGHFVQAEVVELERAGHHVTVVTPAPGGAFGWPGAATRLRARPWLAADAAAWTVRAVRELRAARPERVVAHWAVPGAWPIAALGPDVELEIVSHGGDVRLLQRLPARMRGRLVASLARRASQWRFVSTHLQGGLLASVAEADPRAADMLRAIAVVAASPLGMLDVADDVRARKAGLEGRPLYVCAGRLVASKRVDKVIDYVASKPPGHAPVLVVLGDGPERAHLERLAQRWQIDVRFLGKTPRRETLSWIGAADELVHASHAEGLSTVIREAEELGVPVTRLG
jgi:glycosyltransferase involved in cell wall biosynthesis